MLCENCGVQNESGARLCAKCGAPMPPRSAGGGFGDILSYKPVAPPPAATPQVVSRTDPAMQNLVAQLQKRVEETRKLVLITVGAAVLAALFALIAFIICLSAPDHEDSDKGNDRNEIVDEFVNEENIESLESYLSENLPDLQGENPTEEPSESVEDPIETEPASTAKPQANKGNEANNNATNMPSSEENDANNEDDGNNKTGENNIGGNEDGNDGEIGDNNNAGGDGSENDGKNNGNSDEDNSVETDGKNNGNSDEDNSSETNGKNNGNSDENNSVETGNDNNVGSVEDNENGNGNVDDGRNT